MDDKNIMEDLLVNLKSMVDLCSHAVTEAATLNVHTKFKQILNEILCMQYETFNLMKDKGYYQVADIEKLQMTQMKNKLITC